MESYSVVPELDQEQYAFLLKDVKELGRIEVPIILDEKGNIIDGRARRKAADELGIDCPAEIREFHDEDEKFEVSLRVNAIRRHLTSAQKREAIAAYLAKHPAFASNRLATLIGVSPNTVASVREDLIACKKLKDVDLVETVNGTLRPRKHVMITTQKKEQEAQALKDVVELNDKNAGIRIDAKTAEDRVRRNKPKRKEPGPYVEPLTSDDIQCWHCDFRDLSKVAGLKDGSVKFICTDILYGKKWLPNVEVLAEKSLDWLRDDGIFATYSGTWFLPQVLDGLASTSIIEPSFP